MSLFGTSPPVGASLVTSGPARSSSSNDKSNSLFDEQGPQHQQGQPDQQVEGNNNKSIPAQPTLTSDSLFADDEFSTASPSPWNMPTPRKQQSRADMIRTLLPATNVPNSYVDAFDAVVREDGVGGRINASGVARTLAAANLAAHDQARIMAIVAPDGPITLGRGEFNVLLALVALSQQGDHISLDSVDERRRRKSTVYSTTQHSPHTTVYCCLMYLNHNCGSGQC